MFPKLAAPGVHIHLPNHSITLQSRGCCEGIVQVQMKSESVDLKIGRFFLTSSHEPFQNRIFSTGERKGSQRDVLLVVWKKGNIHCVHYFGVGCCGTCQGNVNGLEKARAVSIWQLAGKRELPYCNHKEVDFTNNQWAWKRTLSSDENYSPCQHLEFSPVDWAENLVMPGLLTFRNYEVINGYCSKLLFMVPYYPAIESKYMAFIAADKFCVNSDSPHTGSILP